jgi:hypothetical protein
MVSAPVNQRFLREYQTRKTPKGVARHPAWHAIAVSGSGQLVQKL